MADEVLLQETDGAILNLTINRPDKLNALNADVIEALSGAVEAAAGDDAVRVIVLRGAGDKAFVAGADISEFNNYRPADAARMSSRGQRLFRRIETLGKPVIAVLDGFALGGGLELAMACTLRVASTNARLGQPEINLGLIPGYGGTQRLARLAGRGVALDLCLTGDPVDAQRALDLGIVNRVHEPGELEGAVAKLAGKLARSAPAAMRGIIDSVLHGGDCPLDAALEYETRQFALCFATDDMREGVEAFLNKRIPEFKGT
jgi:enoyl-CoA hydratase